MDFSKGFDVILDEILTDYQNQLPTVDRSPGTLVFIKSACLASALWGLYKYQDYIARQIFPDTADTVFLERHAAIRGLTRLSNETDAALLARLLAIMQQPPAGGNRVDWSNWALEVSYTHDEGGPAEYTETVETAVCYENPRGIGTINVVITSDRAEAGFEEIPTTELKAAVTTYVNGKRPVTSNDFLVIGATRKVQTVSITTTGLTSDERALVKSDILAHMKALGVGKTLFRAQLMSLGIERGATNVTLTTPAADVTVTEGPTTYERIWAELTDITVSAA